MPSPQHLLNQALRTFARLWAFLRDLAGVLAPCRFSLFVVVAGGALLLSVPQGRELTVRLPDEGAGKIFLFYLCVFIWAFQSWYWARFILDAWFGDDRQAADAAPRLPARVSWLIDHVPRAIGFLAYAVAVLACLVPGKDTTAWIGLSLVPQGLLFYVLLVRRRDLVSGLVRRFPAASAALTAPEPPGAAGLRALSPLARAIVHVTLVGAGGLTVWAGLNPVGMGWFFGSGALPFLGFAAIVPVGSLAVYLGRDGGAARLDRPELRLGRPDRPYPVVSLMVGLALVFSLWVDNHAVRVLADTPAAQAVPLPVAIDRWSDQVASQPPDRPADLVVVATAGGGIRAAYWTATVLGALQDRAPLFRRQLLGISAVSGGSVGAATFVTLLSQPQLPPQYFRCAPEGASQPVQATWTPGPFECAGQAVLSRDFLAPTAAALLFSDLLQQFIPVSFLPDRARALEQALEQAWPTAGFEASLWSARAFGQPWTQDGHLPALLLNGTHVETGKRIIHSPWRIDAQTFPDAFDFTRLLAAPIRPSTAALNSARFTFVSPAGTLGANGRIVDGGYFENFGAQTAADLLRAALRHLQPQGKRVRAIVVLISNEPALALQELPATFGAAGTAPLGPVLRSGPQWGSEALSPVWALFNAREAHAILATHALRDAAGPDGLFFHFHLCRDAQAMEPALGWVLAKESERWMRAQLRAPSCGNAAQLDQLVKLLTSAAP